MVGEVQADGQELAHAVYRHAIAGLAFDQGQGGRVDGLQRLERRAMQLVRGDVGDVARQVADAPLSIQRARLFLAPGAVTQQFHGGGRAFVLTRVGAMQGDVAVQLDAEAGRIRFTITRAFRIMISKTTKWDYRRQ